MTSSTILLTKNTAWGFWGSMGEDAPAAWPRAFVAIHEATTTDPDSVRAFLDSRHGRHFADAVNDALATASSLADAIAVATGQWMLWRITHRTSRETGIPAGLPYLTGFVIHEGIAAEVAHD